MVFSVFFSRSLKLCGIDSTIHLKPSMPAGCGRSDASPSSDRCVRSFTLFLGCMSRINIDADFWHLIGAVVAKIGDYDKAVSNSLRWKQYAQDKFENSQAISEADFNDNGFVSALFGVFAERLPDGSIGYIEAEKHFSWTLQASRAGKKSAESRRKKLGTAIPINAPNGPRTDPERTPNATEPPAPAPAPAPAINFKIKENKEKTENSLCPPASNEALFDIFMGIYPKQVDRSLALKKFNAIKPNAVELFPAVENYLKHLCANLAKPKLVNTTQYNLSGKRNAGLDIGLIKALNAHLSQHIDLAYIKSAANFLDCYRDWLDPKVLKVNAEKPPKSAPVPLPPDPRELNPEQFTMGPEQIKKLREEIHV